MIAAFNACCDTWLQQWTKASLTLTSGVDVFAHAHCVCEGVLFQLHSDNSVFYTNKCMLNANANATVGLLWIVSSIRIRRFLNIVSYEDV